MRPSAWPWALSRHPFAAERRWLALLLALALVARLPLLLTPGYDVRDYQGWARTVHEVGIGGWYGATYPPPPGWYNYPPLYLYPLRATGLLYAALRPRGAWDDQFLAALLKIWPVAAELALGLLLHRFLRRRRAPGAALGWTAAYLLNPAIIWNTAYWGGIDAFHALFLTAALCAAGEGRPARAWPLAVLAIGGKLQAALGALALALPLTRRRRPPWRALLGATATAAATGLALCAPIIARGQFGLLLRAMRSNLDNTTVASANAHNLWWLVARGRWRPDATPILGGLTYSAAGRALFALCALALLWRSWRGASDADEPWESGAFLSFAFCLLTTGVHENWFFTLFAPLAVTAALAPERGYRALYAALSTTFLLNLALHDPPLRELLGHGFDGAARRLGLLNATANCGLFACWLALSRARRAAPARDAERAEDRAAAHGGAGPGRSFARSLRPRRGGRGGG